MSRQDTKGRGHRAYFLITAPGLRHSETARNLQALPSPATAPPPLLGSLWNLREGVGSWASLTGFVFLTGKEDDAFWPSLV